MSEVKRVLIVDDDPYVNAALSALMDHASIGYKVATTIEEAMGLCSNHSFVVAITDLKIGQDDGAVLASKFRESYPDMKIFAFTGTISKRECTNKAFDKVYGKPYDMKDMFLDITNMVSDK